MTLDLLIDFTVEGVTKGTGLPWLLVTMVT